MPDFTLYKYKEFIISLMDNGYTFYTFEDYISLNNLSDPHIVLRHDVDRIPSRALKLARLEHELKVISTYFFRSKSVSFNKEIISQIQEFGHEVGYHYEELSDAKGDYELAWQLFQENVKKFDAFGGIKSIAMHGKPFSKWDNRDLWNKHDYRKFGIQIEVYKDIAWDKYLYFTDVGRCWNSKSNKRDRVVGSLEGNLSNHPKGTTDLIKYINQSNKNIIISTHPERWSDNIVGWFQVLAIDWSTNLMKKLFMTL